MLTLLTYLNCSVAKNIDKKKNDVKYEIVQVPFVYENEKDTLFLNELRFYNIKSALDGIGLINQNYGTWDKEAEGKYQKNIKRFIWEDLKLFESSEEVFTIVADGTETINDYFACLMIFDSQGNDAFNKKHEFNQRLKELFLYKMKKINRSKINYKDLH
ncbi:hypothetical protein H7U19_06400 [Hyunsoonleella sp. SJ7]|uniref:Uncharacterized protein n=1 Tax=Hyunsoonleella aquatilis TaxID=2762758 RepID=A0A923HGL1_9FLAO|nr:hypothetical protein [Hyunsoonleella aquatilis]MBC3758027.1 hypothetical protein [Hyunsoonleella aquatilis]